MLIDVGDIDVIVWQGEKDAPSKSAANANPTDSCPRETRDAAPLIIEIARPLSSSLYLTPAAGLTEARPTVGEQMPPLLDPTEVTK